MNDEKSQETAVAIIPDENSLLGVALTEILGIVGTSIRETMAHDTASSNAYTAELRRRITKLDEEMSVDGITSEEVGKKRSEQMGYLRDLKDEASAARTSSFRTIVCVSGFGAVVILALLSKSRVESLLAQCAKSLGLKSKPDIGFR